MDALPSSFSTLSSSLAACSDGELLIEVERLARGERQAAARLIACLGEVDERRLSRGAGCSSLFTFCTHVLHESEHAASLRIEAARVARRFPIILERLATGALTLTAVSLLAKHLTPANHLELMERARHRSKRELEELVARLAPKPDAREIVRRLPEQRHDASRAAVSGPPPGADAPGGGITLPRAGREGVLLVPSPPGGGEAGGVGQGRDGATGGV